MKKKGTEKDQINYLYTRKLIVLFRVDVNVKLILMTWLEMLDNTNDVHKKHGNVCFYN